MLSDFPRILTLLRKEKGISQKQAAAELGISQALLSHYEKGIRECGLSFVVRCADYYDVSCDYLLGRSPDRKGAVISADDLPDPEDLKDNQLGASVLPVLNKKLLINSIHILYDLLQKYNNKSLTNELSGYLSLAIYKMFRCLFAINEKNPSWMFGTTPEQYMPISSAAMTVTEAKLAALCKGQKVRSMDKIEDKQAVYLTTETMSETYPKTAGSLLNLVKNAELRMKKYH